MTSQIPCLNLISHSITPENDVAMRLSGSDVPVCLRRGGLRKTLPCEQFGILGGNGNRAATRGVLLKAQGRRQTASPDFALKRGGFRG